MAELPTGTVTFLLTDVEGSTALWELAPEAMQVALVLHDAIFERVVTEHRGMHIRPRGEGDSRFGVFTSPVDAVGAAVAILRALAAETWPTPGPLRVRIGLHTGEAEPRDGDYYGLAVNRCARIRAIGHGGQILLSDVTADLVRNVLPTGLTLWPLGVHRLRGLTRSEQIFQVLAPGLPSEFPRLNTLDTELGDFRPGGERREMTVLLVDVRGFTALASTLEPNDVYATLNEYLTIVSEVLHEYQGTLEQFVADGVVAFWGAPIRQDDHAGLACRAALRMVDELDHLNARWVTAGRPTLTMSIGINSGPMLVGNLGSVSRFNYAVMGSTVNSCAQIEKMNRHYGTTVIVSEATIGQTNGLRSRYLDTVSLATSDVPIRLYELVGYAGPTNDPT